MAETEKLDKARGKRIKEARERAELDLSQAEVGRRMGVDVGTVSRWERGAPIKPRDVAALARVLSIDESRIDAEAAKELGAVSGRSQPGSFVGESVKPYGDTFPFRLLMGRPTIRARLAEIRSELIEAGADEATEENLMTTIGDRDRIARNAGGSIDDSYTEAQLLKAINNIAEMAMRFIKGPRL
jgi:transcriptional regulator with XRE-family HTH domain